ncbi:GntR family transcriptional regulator [Paenibacillus guangzhouensis]|uniref:GntR family transcriptional regulator n=1 Tax=Paenibacillus guangzhouensis TaxID=1473112 RepID=UPI001266AA39|nr:GntR family transcriptional regulator [Paenibacillus guangzhouensis]
MANNRLNRYVLTDELYGLLKQKILSHDISAGNKINIDQLARDLGVSNIPIREALFRLASEGFVKVIPFKGMYVAEMTLADIDEIFEIRYALEELAIQKAAPHIPGTRLEQILQELDTVEQMWEASHEENVISKMNHDLHGTIFAYAGNENLKQMVTALIERVHRYLNLVHYKIDMSAEIAEHRKIVLALLEKDTEKAVEASRIHLQQAYQRLRDNFK